MTQDETPDERVGRLTGSLAADQVKRAANRTMRQNCERDGVKYARVPTGAETCGFCIMLASRGFVYSTAQAAGELDHYHRSCDCKIVAGFDGETEIEGYDPDELYDIYVEARTRLGLSDPSTSRLSREIGRVAAERKGKVGSGASFPSIRGKHSIEADLRATNPHYGEGLEWEANCQRCVGAYEMRRRGYDVTAKPRPMVGGKIDCSDELANRLSRNGWPHMFENAELESVSGTTGSAIMNRIAQRMSEYGDGSRAIIRVQWKRQYGGSGHVFIAEQVSGETRFVDPQANSRDCTDYFSKIAKGQTEMVRIDDKATTDLIYKAVEYAS